MGNGGKLQGVSVVAELASALSPRRAKAFALGFTLAFVACTAFLALGTPAGTAAPWLAGIFNSSSAISPAAYAGPYQARLSSLLFHFFPNSSTSPGTPLPVLENGAAGSPGNAVPGKNQTGVVMSSPRSGVGLQGNAASGKNRTEKKAAFSVSGLPGKNQMTVGVGLEKNGDKKQMGSGIGLQSNESPARNDTRNKVGSLGSRVAGNGVPGNRQKETRAGSQANGVNAGKNQTGKGVSSKENGVPARTLNATKAGLQGNGVQSQTQSNSVQASSVQARNQTGLKQGKVSNLTASLMKRGSSALPRASNSESDDKKSKGLIKSLMECDIYHGRWVKDESYPLYLEGSCPHIDEPFNCYLNGRPDRNYQKLRWQPHGCSIPRLNATDMLERLRGRRLVFVGDSLNRNMWESLVCILRNSLKDKSKVLEASGSHEFRTEGSYSFLFKDYNCTVEFFRSPFLVQEWEMPGSNGTKKETLRLDIIEGSSSKYKDAHIVVFNTGHWWTHEKTSKGKDYYQEGNHVYGELNVVDAFHKALNTWAKWVDNNVNPKKTLVFFRGYSASHFSGGQWNSGGACDKETEPIKNEAYLSPYPPKMRVLETVIKGMKVPVSYLNITRMTDYRKDAHPSIYRKQNLSEEERRSPERYQDCSHWCLPGVPDLWNELLYAQLIIKQHQLQQVKA